MKKTIIFVAIMIIIIGLLFVVFYNLGQNKNNQPLPSGEVITKEYLLAEMSRLEKINAAPGNQNINPRDYPIVLGKYSENGLILIESYFCSDVCPAYGGVSIIFQNITSKDDCAKIDGKDIIDSAWGGYIGCAPKIS